MGRVALTSILLYVHYLFVSGDNVQIGRGETVRKKSVIVDITRIIDVALKTGNNIEAMTTLKNLFPDEDSPAHYETGIDIQDMFQLSNLVEKIDNISQGRKLVISVRNHVNSFIIPDLPITSNAVAAMKKITTLMFPISFDDNCEEASALQNHTKALQTFFHTFGIGLGFAYKNSSPCPPSKFVIKNADFIFNVVNFTVQEGFPESYTLARNYLKSIAEENLDLKDSARFGFILRIDPFSEQQLSHSNLEYNLFLSEFGKIWNEESGSSLIIQFSHKINFPTFARLSRSIQTRSKVVIPWIHYRSSTPSFLFQWLNDISSKFEAVYIHKEDLEKMVKSLDEWEPKAKLSQPLNAIAYLNFFSNLNATVAMKEKLKIRNIHLDVLEVLDGIPKDKPIWFDDVIGEISTICTGFVSTLKQPESVMEDVISECGFFINRTGSFRLRLELPLKIATEENFSVEFYNTDVQPTLNAALIARVEILKHKPMEHILLSIRYRNSEYFPLKNSGCYCNEQLLKFNSYHQSIANWATFHDIPVIFVNIFPHFESYEDRITWWTRIEVNQEISHGVVENMPVYVFRNFPGNFTDPNFSVDKCVNWSENVPQDGIPIDKDISGLSVTMDVRKDALSIGDIENMLYFALYKFVTVELLTKKVEHQVTDLQTLNSLLETDFLEALMDLDIKGGRLYLEISVEQTRFAETLKKLETIAEKISQGPPSGLELIGVHLTHWENHTSPEAVAQQVVALGKKLDFQVGLVINNCSQLLNELATSTTSIKVPPTDYLLCQTKSIPAHNHNKEDLSLNLDTNLYISKVFEKLLPGRPVFFRVISSPCCEGDDYQKQTENLFRFLSDVNQFAMGNKLRHFLVQAFTTTKESFSSSGWFHVESFNDLSNPLAISDREEAYTNNINSQFTLKWKRLLKKFQLTKGNKERQTLPNFTEKPKINSSTTDLGNKTSHSNIPEKEVPSNISNWVIGSLGTVILVFVILFVVQTIRVRRNANILSDEEVQEFLLGKKLISNSAQTGKPSELEYYLMKFDESQMIPKSEISLDGAKVLGKGNFGLVYQATVRGENVAVKVPHSGCSKDSFRSMLIETKLLSFIGEHVNVIKFVGAYTKEIQKGAIYIATKLCENGSLQSHLREKQKENREGNLDLGRISPELIKFSKEIAAGMEYIASLNVVHGDLATRNVLLDEYNTCKISDFGLARKMYEYNKYVKKSQEPLPWRWMSYETLNIREFTTKSDVWSFGITIWEIFSLGGVPYSGLSWSPQFLEDIQNGMRLTKPSFASDETFEKILPCWHIDPKERPVFGELVQYFVSNMSSEYRILESPV